MPEVGLRECGGVVDAVADHGNDLAFGLEPTHHVDLVGREHFGDHGVDTDLRRDGVCGSAVVPRQEDGSDPERAQFGDRLRARRLDRVGDHEQATGLAVPRREHRGAVRALRLRRFAAARSVDS